MTEQAYRNWPDLSEFNAELKILRGNAYRPPRLCLALQGAPVSYSALLESLAARTGDVKVAILAAGFDLDESIELNQLLNTVQSGNFLLFEPTRVFRRQFILSHATLADSSNRR